MPLPFPQRGRLVGIDYGHVRVGIAISDEDRTLASPLETYTRGDPQADAERFRRLVDDERVVGFVVGLPVHASGEESAKSQEARRFGQWLSQTTGRPVCFLDERYTTVEAEQMLMDAQLKGKKRKTRRDMLAAQIILSAFLESPSAAEERPRPLDD